LKTSTKFSIPIGGIIAFILFAYAVEAKFWFQIGWFYQFLLVIFFVILTLLGWIEYEREYEK
jgi:hypothetical protein